ncbi:zinc ribbon domain-containing protein [Natrinema halophilum]|nr:zinc ribbon domain-containing protein [Natrinema halophilum]UHQ95977.1 zinc ribbon domain-containing protein [Natrinema halophilum]
MVVRCANCGYSELYKGQLSGNMVDLYLGQGRPLERASNASDGRVRPRQHH